MDDATLVTKALAGDPETVRTMVDHLTPVIQARVARSLMRRSGSAAGRDVRQEVEDISQEVFVALFAQGGRVLRTWSPDKGLSLRNFVGLVAERQTSSILRSGKRSPWTEDPMDSPDLDRMGGTEQQTERRLITRDLLTTVVSMLREELSPKGLHLFELLMLQQRSVAEVCELTGMKTDAVYAWRSRLAKRVRAIAKKVSDSSPPARIPPQVGAK